MGSGGDRRAPLLKALATIDRPALRGLERYGGFFAALRAHRGGLGSLVALPAQPLVPFSLAGFAALGFVLETLVCKEKLFTCGENEFRPTIHALDDLIAVFHAPAPRTVCPGAI